MPEASNAYPQEHDSAGGVYTVALIVANEQVAPVYVTVQPGTEGRLRLTPQECRALSARLLAAAEIADEAGFGFPQSPG